MITSLPAPIRFGRRAVGVVASLLTAAAAAQPAQESPTAPAPAAAATAQLPIVRPMADLKVDAAIRIGKTADWVAITAKGVWVGSTGPNAVSEVDPATNRVTTVALPGNPCAGLAVDDAYLWVPLCGPVPQLAKVDLATRTLASVLKVGPAGPEGGVAVGAGSVWLVTDKAGSLARIDPASGAIVQTVQLPPGSYNPVFSGGLVWVSRADGAEVTVVDPSTGGVTGHIALGPHPRFTTAGGGFVWTLNQLDGSLSRVDIATRTASPPLPLNTPGPGGDITYADGRVWTTMMETPLTAIDARANVVLCQWKGEGGDSLGIGHGAIWLTTLRAGTVSRISLAGIPADCAAAPSADLPRFAPWISGTAADEPTTQVQMIDADTAVIRQSVRTNFEAPFLYLLFGRDRALLLDTGAGGLNIRPTVDRLIEAWRSRHDGRAIRLVVAHSHGHGDHHAGDDEFAGRPDTDVVGLAPDRVAAFFRIADWPRTIVPYDLGGRVLDIIPTPGHEPAHIMVYDRRTRLLFSGDMLYPGRLYVPVDRFDAFRASADRLAAFGATHPIRALLGAHIEMTTSPGRDYPMRAATHPSEHPLPLAPAAIDELQGALAREGSPPTVDRHADFIVFPVPPRPAG